MTGVDEIVALYDEGGRPSGSAPRSRMRAENLRHAATAVVVRDSLGRVYVHRRTDSKDVYPGRWDFTAGGVLLDGEDPDTAARREAEEELGVTSPLEPLGEGDYADDHTRYHAYLYRTTWDGPVRWQPEEVATGEWVTLERLAAMIDDPAVAMMPDAEALLGGWLRDRLGHLEHPGQGWDSETTIVEGRWVDRVPRRPDVARRLLAETRLLPRIAPLLPLDVPVPVVLDEHPLRVRHPIVVGRPCDPARLTAADGACVGEFLRVLHDTPPATYHGTGVPTAASARADLLESLEGMRGRVLPLLPPGRRRDGESLLAAVGAPAPTCLVHADLGPEHVLVADDPGLRTQAPGRPELSDSSAGSRDVSRHEGQVTGVIDWSDAIVGDPALDLAWTVHGTAPAFAEAVVASYGASRERRDRGLLWHRLGPWYEALAGVDFLGEETTASGLAGILERL